jgi:DNA-binding LytR/AlgR family response regulator
MSHRCIIVEDQLPAQRILGRYLDDIPELELVGTFTDPLSAMPCLRQQQVDLIFLDIHLPKLSGMDFLKILPYKPKVILTTAFPDYALEGYEHDVVDYLLKPISLDRFLKAVSKVIYPEEGKRTAPAPPKSPASSMSQHLFVKSDRSIIRLSLKQLRYIQAEDDYTRVFTQEKMHFLSYTLKYWQEALPQPPFCRVHKSYLINLEFVERIEGNRVFISGVGDALPIGRSFRTELMRQLELPE